MAMIKNIARCRNKTIKTSQDRQCSLGTKKSVNYHFYTANENHTETPEYECME